MPSRTLRDCKFIGSGTETVVGLSMVAGGGAAHSVPVCLRPDPGVVSSAVLPAHRRGAEHGSVLLVRPPTRVAAFASPGCCNTTERVHAYHHRRLVHLPAAGRGVVVELRVRRLVCQS